MRRTPASGRDTVHCVTLSSRTGRLVDYGAAIRLLTSRAQYPG